MSVNKLNRFCYERDGGFKQANDAVFHAIEALSGETSAHHFFEWSRLPAFPRKEPGLDEALEGGQRDADPVREVFSEVLRFPTPGPGNQDKEAVAQRRAGAPGSRRSGCSPAGLATQAAADHWQAVAVCLVRRGLRPVSIGDRREAF